jgi:hypothetical protein|eukprot:168707-Prymnesium_polylepis.1
MKRLQEEVRTIAQMSVDALNGTALELDAIHQRQAARLKRDAAAEQQAHAAAWEHAQLVHDLSFRLLAEELTGIECMCCEVEDLPPEDAPPVDEPPDAAAGVHAECTHGSWCTPVMETPYFTPASSSVQPSREARAETGGPAVGDAGGPEALEAWLAQRKTELFAARGVADQLERSGTGGESGDGAEEACGEEVLELRREVEALKVQLEVERRAKRKILASTVVCPECEAVF